MLLRSSINVRSQRLILGLGRPRSYSDELSKPVKAVLPMSPSTHKSLADSGYVSNVPVNLDPRGNSLASKVLSEKRLEVTDSAVKFRSVDLTNKRDFSLGDEFLQADLGHVDLYKSSQILLKDVDPNNIPDDKEIVLMGKKAKLTALGRLEEGAGGDGGVHQKIFIEESRNWSVRLTWKSYLKAVCSFPIVYFCLLYIQAVREHFQVKKVYSALDQEDKELLDELKHIPRLIRKVESVEELKAVIKEKNKENKNLQKKLGKLEDGYVKKHTELSEILAEKEFFVRLFKLIFPDKTWDKTLSTKDYEQLESLWITREEEVRQSVLAVSEISNKEIQKLKTAITKKTEDVQEKDETIKALRLMEMDYIQTQANLAECKGEILALEKQLEVLKLESAAVRSIQDELAKTKASSLLAALDQQRPGTKSDTNTELEKTQKQLSAALKRIEELENMPTSREHEVPAPSSTVIEDMTRQKAEYERRVEDLQEKLETQKTEFQEHRKKAQKMIMEKDMAIERLRQTSQREPSSPAVVLSEEVGPETAQQIASLRLRVMDLERAQTNGKSLNVEYLRNIVAKYMEYMNAANYPEAKTLEGVISTVLNFSPEDVELIHKAKEESGIMHKMTTILNAKSPGVGVSHNTLHTVEGRKRARLTIPHSVNVSLSNTYRSVDEEEKYEVVSLDKS